jgi:hypothetical protein
MMMGVRQCGGIGEQQCETNSDDMMNRGVPLEEKQIAAHT